MRKVKVIRVLLSILIITSLASCIPEGKEGDWADNIKLSQKEVEFKAETDSVVITTQGEWWWISSIQLKDSTYSYYHRDDIDLSADSYRLEDACFVVERREKNSLFIKMNENPSGEERLLTVVLEAGNYFDRVTITQAAK